MRSTISANDTYTVYVGGTSTSKTSVATISAAEKYTIIFEDADGNELAKEQYAPNADVTIPADQNKDEHTFMGWKVKGSEDSTAVKTGIKATADNVTYVPVFKANSTGTADKFKISGTISNYTTSEFLASLDETLAALNLGEETATYKEKLVSGFSTYVRLYSKSAWDDGTASEYASYYVGESNCPTPIATVTVSADNGSYVIDNLDNGEYVIVADREAGLPYARYVTINNSDVEVRTQAVYYGDTNKDGYTENSDGLYIIQNSAMIGEEMYVPGYDLNYDFFVENSDGLEIINTSKSVEDYIIDDEDNATLLMFK